LVGHLLLRQHSGLSVAVKPTPEAIVILNARDDGFGEQPSFAWVPTSLVQYRSDLAIGVVVEEAIDFGDHFAVGLPDHPGRLRHRRDQRPYRSTLEPDLNGELFTLGQGDIFDQEPCHPFSLPIRRVGVVSEFRKIGR
jgi:hypothetical protein